MRDPQTLFSIPSPCYVLEEERLHANLSILNSIQIRGDVKILLALKGYAFWRRFDELKKILFGSTASGLYEARLGYEEIGGREEHKEVCVYSPAFKALDMPEILNYATHIIFNSFAQWQTFKPMIERRNEELARFSFKPIEVGLRVNPLYSEVQPPIYNPCTEGSRLGITPSAMEDGIARYGLEGVSGLHFHTHCEQDSHALQRTLLHFEKYFGNLLHAMKWVNFGGGHHITREDYDCDNLLSLIADFKARYNGIDIFLEPGEAVGWQVGFLLGEVVDVVENEGAVAVLDVSASCHMPDCLEMPYRPRMCKISSIDGSLKLESDLGEGIGEYCYRLGGPTCLSGDIIGNYSFHTPLHIGDRVIFEDMLHYTIVKNTTFNGIGLPSLGVIDMQGNFHILKKFDYDDYKQRN